MNDDSAPDDRTEQLLSEFLSSRERLAAAHADFMHAMGACQEAYLRLVQACDALVDELRVEAGANGRPVSVEAPGAAAHAAAGVERPNHNRQVRASHSSREQIIGAPNGGGAPAVTGGERVARRTVLRLVEAGDSDRPSRADVSSRWSSGWPSGWPAGAHVLLTDDGFGVAARLARLLESRGARVVVGGEAELDEAVDSVVFLGGLRAVHTLDEAFALHAEALGLAERFGPRLSRPGAVWVGVLDTGGGFGLCDFDPVQAPLGGLVGLHGVLASGLAASMKAGVEAVASGVRTIDLAGEGLSVDALAARLADELVRRGPAMVAVGSDGVRRVVEAVADDAGAGDAPPDGELALRERAVMIVARDAAGPRAQDDLFAAALEALARRLRPRILLLEAPAGADGPGARLEERLAAAGAAVRTATLDVRDFAGLMDALDEVRVAWGPVEALVYGPAGGEGAGAPQVDSGAAFRAPVDTFNLLVALLTNEPLARVTTVLSASQDPVAASMLGYLTLAEGRRRGEETRAQVVTLAAGEGRAPGAPETESLAAAVAAEIAGGGARFVRFA